MAAVVLNQQLLRGMLQCSCAQLPGATVPQLLQHITPIPA
jgi:hypothetical protein